MNIKDIKQCNLNNKIKVINYFCEAFQVKIEDDKIILTDIYLDKEYETNEEKINELFDYILENFNLFDVERIILRY